MKNEECKIKLIRCDNNRENKSLKEKHDSSAWKLQVQFEFTARDTPKQSHLADLDFRILTIRERTMMYAASLPENIWKRLFTKASKVALMLDGLKKVESNVVVGSRF